MGSLILALIMLHGFLQYASSKLRSPYLFAINLVLIILSSGQAVYIGYSLANADSVIFLNETITRSGYRLALFLYVCCLCVLIIFTLPHIILRKNAGAMSLGSAVPARALVRSSYPILFMNLAIGLAYLVYVVGGFRTLLFTIRPTFVPGATAPLIILLGTRFLFYAKIANKQKLTIFDWTLLVSILAIFNQAGSRLLIVIFIAPLLFTFFYGRDLSFKARYLVLALVGAFAILILSQAIKAYFASRFSENAVSIIQSVLIVFYKAQVEVFSGFSGYISFALENGFKVDYGLSLFSTLVLLLPNGIRALVPGFARFVSSGYTYEKSIVAPGLQNVMVYFGFFGPYLLFVGLSLLQFAEYAGKRQKHSMKSMVMILLLSHSFNLIRGTIPGFLFFLLSDTFIMCFAHITHRFRFLPGWFRTVSQYQE